MSSPTTDEAAGYAALAICESLLLALTDLDVIGEKDSRDLLSDAVSAYRTAGQDSRTPALHDAVVAILERILAGKNSVPNH